MSSILTLGEEYFNVRWVVLIYIIARKDNNGHSHPTRITTFIIVCICLFFVMSNSLLYYFIATPHWLYFFFKYSLNLVFYMYIMDIFVILESDALFTRYVRNFKQVIAEVISSKSRSIIIGVFIINKTCILDIARCKWEYWFG